MSGTSTIKKSMYNVAYKGVNILYPLITSAYISRILMAKGVGDVAFAINIVSYFIIAASLGIPNYAIKAIAGIRDDMNKRNRVFSELASIVSVSSVAATMLYFMAVTNVSSIKSDNILINIILGFALISNAVNYDWLFEAMEDYRYIAVRTTVIKLISLLFLILFVKKTDDIIIYIAIYSFTLTASNICNGIASRKYVRFSLKNLNVKQHLKAVFILFAASCATDVYTLLDSTMLGIMCPSEYLGYYSNSTKIVRAVYGMIIAATTIYFPRLSNLYATGKKQEYDSCLKRCYNISMLLAIPTAVGMIMTAGWFIPIIFGSDFKAAAFTTQLLSVLVIVFSIATVFGHISLIIYGKEKNILIATIVGAVINFTLNYILIPVYAQNGAAIASLIGELAVTVILVVSSLRSVYVNLLNKDILKVIFAAMLMLGFLSAVKLLADSGNIITLIIAVAGGIAVYAAAILAVKNSEAMLLIDIIRRRVKRQ